MPTGSTPTERAYHRIVEAFSADPSVSVGAEGKKGFGASALQVNGKIFAMLSSKGNFVLKLPKPRVDALVDDAKGKRFEPSPGRIMKEWIEMQSSTAKAWISLSEEAKEHVGGKKIAHFSSSSTSR